MKVNWAFLLNPKIRAQSKNIPFNSFKWEGPYIVVKVLSHANYIVRKIGTFQTQSVHRMRLRPFVPHDTIEDVNDDANRHYSDPDGVDDQTLFNDKLPEPAHSPATEKTSESDTNEVETTDTDHGTVYNEYRQIHEVPPLASLLQNTSTLNIRTEMKLKINLTNQQYKCQIMSLNNTLH